MNLKQFIYHFWEVLEPNTPLVWNWHHDVMCRALQMHVVRINAGLRKSDTTNEVASRDVVINVPPRTTKSLIVTVMFPAWAWTMNPSLSFLTVSYSGALATKHSRLSRNLVQSDQYRQTFPQAFEILTDQNVKSHYENNLGGGRYAVGLGGSATGSGGDIIIVDDPLNPKQAASDTERSNANRDYDETIYNRTTDPNTAVRIIVMQRLHEDDLTGHVLKKDPESYYHICLPSELTPDVSPQQLREHYQDGLLWRERFTADLLQSYQRSLGSYGYAGQYLQRPSPSEGGLLKREWFKTFSNVKQEATINLYIDPAYTEKEENDPSSLLAVYEDGSDYYIVACDAVRYEFPDLIRYIQTFSRRVGCDRRSMVYVEPKASGKSIVQVLKSQTDLNVVEDINPTKDKVSRVKNISPIVEAGRVHLLMGAWTDAFLDECAAFPNGVHDDRVDTLVMALQQNRNNFFAI